MTEDGFVSNLKPPSEVLILWKLQRQKGQLESWPFLKVVGERGLFPCGPLLKQRCLAALGANLLRRFSSSGSYRDKKASSRAGFFLKWSAREDYSPAGRCCSNVVSLRSAQTSFGASHPLEATETKKPARELAFS